MKVDLEEQRTVWCITTQITDDELMALSRVFKALNPANPHHGPELEDLEGLARAEDWEPPVTTDGPKEVWEHFRKSMNIDPEDWEVFNEFLTSYINAGGS